MCVSWFPCAPGTGPGMWPASLTDGRLFSVTLSLFSSSTLSREGKEINSKACKQTREYIGLWDWKTFHLTFKRGGVQGLSDGPGPVTSTLSLPGHVRGHLHRWLQALRYRDGQAEPCPWWLALWVEEVGIEATVLEGRGLDAMGQKAMAPCSAWRQ